jgi:hypothetical protein
MPCKSCKSFCCCKTLYLLTTSDVDIIYHNLLIYFPINLIFLYCNVKQEDWVLCRVFYKTRATIAKPPTGSSYNMESATASSLPPLIDNNYIAFDHQAGMQNLEGYEQVPCFSNNPSSHPQSSASMDIQVTAPMADQEHQHMGKAIKDALSQLTRFEQGNVKREVPAQGGVFAQDGFEYLAESGFSQMWNSLN